jgi:hypothetical protein
MRKGLLLALLMTVLGAIIVWQGGWLATPPAPVPAVPPPSPPPPFQSRWATEQDWIVDTITRDVREMAAFAAGQRLPEETAPAVRADAVIFETHVFAPTAYAPLAVEVWRSSASPPVAGPSSSSEDLPLLQALLDLRSEVLARENARLSRRLAEEPRDAEAHERAALLLGAFALRDAAGYYTDRRPALCRMSAHMSLARALRGGAPPGQVGRLADILLESLVGRQADALAGLDALDSPSRVVSAWARALRLFNTGDWRIARDASDLTLLEKLQEFAALAENLQDLAALDWLEAQGAPEPIPDWGLLALSCGSVETFNRFAPAGPAALMVEAATVWEGMDRPGFEDLDDLLEALNARPGGLLQSEDGGGIQPSVIDWGLWADRVQRHLVYALVTESFHLGGVLGQSGAAEAFTEDARSFSRLELFPLFLTNAAADLEHFRPAMAASRALALRSPERLSAGIWSMLREERSYVQDATHLPDEKTWFRPALLPGTLIDFQHRAELLPELRSADLGRRRELRELAPYNVAVTVAVVARMPAEERTTANLAPLYGALGEYSVYAMGKLTDAAWYDPPEFRSRQGALCELLAERCFHLGYRLAELGYAEEAATAYQSGFDRARDRVAAANDAEWLVRHYLETGQIARAQSVARTAASTHSAGGLLALAMVMEESGKLSDAERLYRQVFETYDQPLHMAGFYYRRARVEENEAYEDRLRAALALALPGRDLEPLDRGALPSPPTDGVVLRGANDNTERYGIKWGHVIVGLDGFRVRDVETYSVVRALSYSPRMKLVVWRGTGYDDIDVELWDRRFRIAIEDLAPEKEQDDSGGS